MNKVFTLNRFSRILTGFLFFILVNSISFAQENLPSPQPDRIILNLAQEANTSISVTWRTDLSVSAGYCELQLTPAGRIDPTNSESFKAKTTKVQYKSENEPTLSVNQHSFTFTNLSPGQQYIYRVGTKENWSAWIEFRMPTNASDEFSFIYFGDPQNDLKSQWSRIVRKAYKYNPNCSFMLYAGDIINHGGNDSEWEEWFNAGSYIFASVPQILTPGNHDYIDLALDPHWHTQFSQAQNGPGGLKSSCFFVDYKNLRIISFDSAAEYELEDENGFALKTQKSWLDSVLQSNTKDWVIVTTHLPFYSPKESRDNDILRKHFQPIIEKHKVDLVLTGHDHSYGRGTASDNQKLKSSIVYVVSVSGPKLYEAGDKEWMQQKGVQMQLFQNIRINNNVLVYESYTAAGQLFDKFSLKKRKNGKNKFIEQKPNIN